MTGSALGDALSYLLSRAPGNLRTRAWVGGWEKEGVEGGESARYGMERSEPAVGKE